MSGQIYTFLLSVFAVTATSAFCLDNSLLTGLKAADKSIWLRNRACWERWGMRPTSAFSFGIALVGSLKAPDESIFGLLRSCRGRGILQSMSWLAESGSG